MLFSESKREKQLRLETQDLRNELGCIKAKQNNMPFFIVEYTDDDRPKKQKKDVSLIINLKK